MDHRDKAALTPERLRVHSDRAHASFTFEAEPYIDTEVTVKIVWEVCPTCDGRGSHVNPSIDSHGISAEEFADDPDFAESYFAGHYDVPCYECSGERVIAALDREHTDPAIIKAYDDRLQWEHDYALEVEAERRFGY